MTTATEVAHDPVLAVEERGRHAHIVSYSNPPFDSHYSGNTTDVCPVGALTTRDFRFGARAWELTNIPSLCDHCSVGCNTVLSTRAGQIKRVMPRQNETVNEIWLCDKGRFGYHYTKSVERLTQPLVRRQGELVPATWDEALTLVAERLGQARDRAEGPVSSIFTRGESVDGLFWGGVGAGPPLIVVHGAMGVDHTYFRPWMDRLADRATVVYFDLTGLRRLGADAGDLPGAMGG